MNDTTKIITATEFKSNLGKYLDYVSDENEVIITKNGNKTVRLMPYINDIESSYTVKEQSFDYQYGGKKVSYEEFMDIYEKSDLRLEYINGEIVLLSSPTTNHQNISGNLYIHLRTSLTDKKCKVFYSPFDVHFYKKGLNTPDVMQPDLLITCDIEDTVNEKGKYMGTPVLCIEILSKSTRSKDMVDKLNTYMLSGVEEFWIVDPDKKSIMVYRFVDNKIEEYTTFKSGETLKCYIYKHFTITVNQIFQ